MYGPLPKLDRYVPGASCCPDSGSVGAGVGLGVGAGVAVGTGVEPGPPTPLLGTRLMPIRAMTTTAAAAMRILIEAFMCGTLRAGHQARRCRVAGTWSSTASRTRSGSAVTPSSSHDRTMRVTSRSVLTGQPPAAPVERRPRGPRAGRASRDVVGIGPSRRGRRGSRRPRRAAGRGSGGGPPLPDGRWIAGGSRAPAGRDRRPS